ncbi:DUF3667 domain-containing protein [Fulvivirga lutimaris]|uniref:DUF3667 domain-containing protein n=1 Tax=Fulvivirga lutimaris TaxID=1819566 RepID=UPI00162997FC|nr:DUF3667 domain-containing protein [Fulvivirga lutimaris]
MKIRRKSNNCLNCGANLDSVYNYCPICGQENNNSNVSVKTLLGDFFNTYLAVDSKFAKSIKPFFIKPGFLTNQYIEGKRASYAHPIRLYLIVSIFYFFIISIVGGSIAAEEDDDEGGSGVVNVQRGFKSVEGVTAKENRNFKRNMYQKTEEQIYIELDTLRDFNTFQKALLANITEKEREEITKDLDSAGLYKYGFIESSQDFRDSILAVDIKSIARRQELKDSVIASNQNLSPITIDSEEGTIFDIFDKLDYNKFNKYKYDRSISDQSLYDSLNVPENATDFQVLMVKQSIRVQRADDEQIVQFILKNLPLMMLLLIPLFALVLKILYVRRKQELYIKHLIHALHLHSFAYFIYGVSLIIIHYMIADEDLQVAFGAISFIGVSTYTYISFMKVYKQKWLKTFIKFNLVGAVYFSLIMTFFVAELLISLLLF